MAFPTRKQPSEGSAWNPDVELALHEVPQLSVRADHTELDVCDLALGVDQHHAGKSSDLEVRSQHAAGVREQWIRHTGAPHEVQRPRGLGVEVVDAEHPDLASGFSVQLLVVRHLRAARAAPLREQVDDEWAAQPAEVHVGPAAQTVQGHVWELASRGTRLALFDSDPLLERSEGGSVHVHVAGSGRGCLARSLLRLATGEKEDGEYGEQRSPHARPSVRTSFAALTGSVGPSPYDGHQRATVHAPQAGLRAWHTRRPCQMRWCDSIVQSRLGNSTPTSCSTFTGSVSDVHPKRRANRPKWVSTVMPGRPNALPSTTFAVLRPTPGRVTRSSSVFGTWPPYRSTRACDSFSRDSVLARKKPVGWMICSSFSRSAAAIATASGYAANNAGRTAFTRRSVVCADSTVTTSISKAFSKSSSDRASGYVSASTRSILRARRTSEVSGGTPSA